MSPGSRTPTEQTFKASGGVRTKVSITLEQVERLLELAKTAELKLTSADGAGNHPMTLEWTVHPVGGRHLYAYETGKGASGGVHIARNGNFTFLAELGTDA